MSKLTENAFRDVNIAFANELSLICDKLNINVWELIQLANRHPRVNVLSPGPGVGGHCIAVDPWFIVNSAPDQAKLIRTAREVNDGKPQFVIDKVNSKLSEFKKPCVACLGVAFKADIDDLRESPSLDITLQLASQENCKVLVVEPNIKTLPSKLSTSAAKLVSIEQALQEADVFVLLVDHKEFKAMSIDEFDGKPLIDTRGVF
jgi:UDP-N-acetyl-D-mannosaminuronic acid dehydrogenase